MSGRVARRQDALEAIHRKYVQDTGTDAKSEPRHRDVINEQVSTDTAVDIDVDLESAGWALYFPWDFVVVKYCVSSSANFDENYFGNREEKRSNTLSKLRCKINKVLHKSARKIAVQLFRLGRLRFSSPIEIDARDSRSGSVSGPHGHLTRSGAIIQKC